MTKVKRAVLPTADLSQWGGVELLSNLIRSAPMAIVAVDQQGIIHFTNDHLNQLFKYEEGELIGQPVEVLMPVRVRSVHESHRTNYTQQPKARLMGNGMDLVGLKKGGVGFPIEVGLSHSFVGEQMIVMASVVDLSLRKQTEETLERRVAERTHELEQRRQISDGLGTVLAMVNANRPLPEILDSITGNALRLLNFDCSILVRWTPGRFALMNARGVPPGFSLTQTAELTSSDQQELAELLRNQAPLVIDDSARLPHFQSAILQRTCVLLEHGVRLIVIFPVMVKGEICGTFTLMRNSMDPITDEELSQASIFCQQAGLAVENARLHTELEEAAVTAERSRIAHDLHDSVTQTLFSASMIADVLPRIWERRPEEGQHRLAELRDLTRGALAEMRTLLLELRPETLEMIELPELLIQLAAAFSGRARLPIHLKLPDTCVLASKVRIALYRIAQEALNNIAKHAEAENAWVEVKLNEVRVELTIRDDGNGFNLDHVRGNHLGLNIMRERASEIQAQLNVSSCQGEGTTVQVVWRAG